MRLLVLATYRDTEPSRSPLLADVVAGLARRPDVASVELGLLAEPDIATILEHAGRRPVLAAEVRDATEGNRSSSARCCRRSATAIPSARHSRPGCATSSAGGSAGCPSRRPMP